MNDDPTTESLGATLDRAMKMGEELKRQTAGAKHVDAICSSCEEIPEALARAFSYDTEHEGLNRPVISIDVSRAGGADETLPTEVPIKNEFGRWRCRLLLDEVKYEVTEAR